MLRLNEEIAIMNDLISQGWDVDSAAWAVCWLLDHDDTVPALLVDARRLDIASKN